MTEVYIKLPLEVGRTDDYLAAHERALAEYISELPAERIKAIFDEATELALLRTELEIALREGLD